MRIGGISKAGHRYPRQMLVVSAMAPRHVRHGGARLEGLCDDLPLAIIRQDLPPTAATTQSVSFLDVRHLR
jgi:hypothetical protein